jgi:hypothetical protein
MSPRRRTLHILGLLVVTYLLVESVTLLGLTLLRARTGGAGPGLLELTEDQRGAIRRLLSDTRTTLSLDAELGWTVRANSSNDGYRANAAGLRADRDYPVPPPEGRIRVAAFGDSFTFGTEVSNQDTWAAKLERLDARLEVLNFGVPAYGTDQALLRYRREGARVRPDIVLIGYLSENIGRHVSVYRHFYDPGTVFPVAKPRFVLRDAGLELLANPLPRPRDYERLLSDERAVLLELGRHDYFFHKRRGRTLPSLQLAGLLRDRVSGSFFDFVRRGRYNTDSEAFAITVRILEGFHRRVIEDGALPVILIFPTRADLLGRAAGEDESVYGPLLERLRGQGLRHVDLMRAFDGAMRSHRLDDLIGVHYTALGNELVARHVAGALEPGGPIDQTRRQRATTPR